MNNWSKTATWKEDDKMNTEEKVELNIPKANETVETVALGHAVHDETAEFDREKAMAAVEAQEAPQTPHDLAQSNETRRGKHNEWALVGLQKGVPIWRYDWTMRQLNTKYPPEKLRAFRVERGVGSSKKRNLTTA